MKRKICILMAALLLLCQNVAWASVHPNKVLFELGSLGIIRGDESGELRLEDNITRSEFVQLVIRMLGYEEITESGGGVFADVPADSPGSGAIILLYRMGYVQGDEQGNFRPNDNILLRDCIKILVHILGYDVVAAGDYPQGYLAAAARISLTDGVNGETGAYATRRDAAMLIYNTLYSYPLERKFVSAEERWEASDTTLIEDLLGRRDVEHISGVVAANYDTWLVTPLSHIKKNQVEIDGQLFNLALDDASIYLGRRVEVYYQTETSGEKNILNIALSTRNSELRVESKYLISVEDKTIHYYDENDRERRADIAADAVWLYNGRLLTDYNEADRLIDGEYLCVDNDGDETYDYIFMNEAEYAIVDRINENGCIYLRHGLLVDGKPYILFDQDTDITCRIFGSNGTEIKPTELQPDDVLSVYQSRDGMYLRVYVSQKVITGTLEQSSDDRLTISGEEYGLWSHASLTGIRLGTTVKAYVSDKNEVIYLEEDAESGYGYGYITGFSQKGIGGYEVQMLLSGPLVCATETDEEDDDGTEIPVLICRNSAIQIFELPDKLMYNGSRDNAENVVKSHRKNVPVRIGLNKENQIVSLEQLLLEYGSITTRMDYNAKDKTFGGIAGIRPFGVNEKSQIICIPSNEGASSEDMLAQIKIDNRDKSVRYLASGYLMDEDTKCVKLLVIIQEMSADTVLNLTATSRIGVVSGQSLIVDENGDMLTATTITSDGGSERLLTRDVSSANGDVGQLKKGDFILFSLNNDNYLVNAKIIKSLEGTIEHKQNAAGQLEGSITGIVTDICRLEIDNDRNRRVHILTLKAGALYYDVDLPARNLPNIYIYNRRSGRVSIGSLDDIQYGDLLCAARPRGNTADCVIVRGD